MYLCRHHGQRSRTENSADAPFFLAYHPLLSRLFRLPFIHQHSFYIPTYHSNLLNSTNHVDRLPSYYLHRRRCARLCAPHPFTQLARPASQLTWFNCVKPHLTGSFVCNSPFTWYGGHAESVARVWHRTALGHSYCMHMYFMLLMLRMPTAYTCH